MSNESYKLACEPSKTVFKFCNYLTENEIPGLEVIKLFPCSNQLSMKFIMLINVKMSTIVGILTFISMINTVSESFKARKGFNFHHFTFYEPLKFHAQLSMKKVL